MLKNNNNIYIYIIDIESYQVTIHIYIHPSSIPWPNRKPSGRFLPVALQPRFGDIGGFLHLRRGRESFQRRI